MYPVALRVPYVKSIFHILSESLYLRGKLCFLRYITLGLVAADADAHPIWESCNGQQALS